MSNFKEIKKKQRVKAWESKIRRLYACELLSEDDLKFLNLQYDLYKVRKSNSYIWGISIALVFYRFPLFYDFHWVKRLIISLTAGSILNSKLRSDNRKHFETLIFPYFEKYYIK